jgi:protein-tyrosine-phosphatase
MDPDNYVIAMDDSNMRDLKRRFGDHPRLYRLLDFAQNSSERNVPDPITLTILTMFTNWLRMVAGVYWPHQRY